MFDELMVLRAASAGNLTADETTTAKKLGPTPVSGWSLVVHVPQDSGAGDTLAVTLEGSHDNQNFVAETPALDCSAKGNHTLRFISDYEYHRAVLNGTDGAADGVNFGAVVVEVTPHYKWPHDMPNK